MVSEQFGLASEAVIVLGAGASRSEALHQAGGRRRVLPPLDHDFFRQMQLLSRGGPSVRAMLEAAIDLFDTLNVGMEQFYTVFEFCQRLHEIHATCASVEPGLKHLSVLDEFQHVLLQVLVESGAIGGSEDDGLVPVLHRSLAGMLQPFDAVITFNYDTLIDRALAEVGGGFWDPTMGYGVEAEGDVGYWRPAGDPPTAADRVHVLKMHGSAHWSLTKGRLRLTRPPHDPAQMAIVLPAWDKPLMDRPLFDDIWNLAYLRLYSARALVVLGYSLPGTDMWVQALMRSVAAGRHAFPLEHIILADPDESAVNRLLSVWSRATDSHTRVTRFHDVAEAVSALTGVRPEPRRQPRRLRPLRPLWSPRAA